MAYQVFRHGNRFGVPAGAIGRGEFGIEIIVALAYQVYCLGLSVDKACSVLSFFQQLKLRKSQADALLNQLADVWENEFENLCMRLMLDQKLFVFVTEATVDDTNRAAERQLPDDSIARKTGRTSKTPSGARRRSVISSVLQSIGKQLECFTLESVIGEANRWLEVGRSCFADQIEARGLSPPESHHVVLDSQLGPMRLLDQVILLH